MDDKFEIDRSKWKKPTYLGHYDERAAYYEGIRTRCRKCGESFVFSGKAQKKTAFEVESRYPGWLPTLCLACSSEWDFLEKRISEYENSWEANRSTVGHDKEFLSSWMSSLKEAQPYGRKHFDSRVRVILKILESLA